MGVVQEMNLLWLKRLYMIEFHNFAKYVNKLSRAIEKLLKCVFLASTTVIITIRNIAIRIIYIIKISGLFLFAWLFFFLSLFGDE